MSSGDFDVDDSLIAMFCSITGADESTAAHYLGASGGDVDVAVGLFMDSGNNKGTSGSMASPTSLPVADENEVRQPIRPTRGVLIDDNYAGGDDTSHWIDPVSFGSSPMRPRPNIPAFMSLADSADLSTERGRRLAQLFQPPTRINFVGSFDGARRLAKSQQRWLVVSLYDGSEFQCQMLNRDLWNDETVQEFVLEHLIFMQLLVGSTEGDRYMRFYPFTGHPHISLIDPRTGKAVKVWNRIPSPADFMGEVIEIIESQPFKPALQSGKLEVIDVENDDNSDQEEDVKVLTETSKEDLFFDQRVVDEPEASAPGATLLQFRLPDGTRLRRRFLQTQTVHSLFTFISHAMFSSKAELKDFDILEHTTSLKSALYSTLESLGIKNASLNVVLA